MSEQWREDETREDEQEVLEHKQGQKGTPAFRSKWRQDGLSSVTWAVILIWVGLVLLLENLNVLSRQAGLTGWTLILLGAGVILLLEAAVRLMLPSYRRPLAGTVILAVVLLAIGAVSGGGWARMWPIVLVIVGLVMIFRSLVRRP